MILAATVLVFSTTAFGGSTSDDAFAKLKTLAGTWQFKMNDADVESEYSVHSMGNSVEESYNDMVTMFHVDGKSLLITHYCHCGNQPRFRATKLNDPNRMIFDFVDIGRNSLKITKN